MVVLQSEGHSWNKLILEDSACSFPTGPRREKHAITEKETFFTNYKKANVKKTFHHSCVQAARFFFFLNVRFNRRWI